MLCPNVSGTQLILNPNHLQLAAQTPSEWGNTRKNLEDATLAIRKVAWRALLEGLISSRHVTGVPGRPTRLGRLKDSLYEDWSSFLRAAEDKMGVDLIPSKSIHIDDGRDDLMERRFQVFHTIRCILGPVVESFILLDRQEWLRKELFVSEPNFCIWRK